MIFISEPHRHSGNSVESGVSRCSNFDIFHPRTEQSYMTAAAKDSAQWGLVAQSGSVAQQGLAP
jgi:hypothetical protein